MLEDRRPTRDALTVEEALDLLGVSRGTFYRIIREGHLTPLPISPLYIRAPRTFYDRASVEALREKAARAPGQNALTYEEAVRTLGICKSTFERLVREGKIAPLPAGSVYSRKPRHFYDRATIEALRGSGDVPNPRRRS